MADDRAYETLLKEGKFPNSKSGNALINSVEARFRYEIVLEYGLNSRIGRTLEKSGVSVLALQTHDMESLLQKIIERANNEAGVKVLSSAQVVCIISGWVYHMRQNGAFNLSVYNAYIQSGARGYLLSHRFKNWMPGLFVTPKFMTTKQVNGISKGFEVMTEHSWYLRNLSHAIGKTPLECPGIFQLAGILIEEMRNRGILEQIPGPGGLPVFALKTDVFRVSGTVCRYRCQRCGHTVCVANEDTAYWGGAHCQRNECTGVYAPAGSAVDYFGKLYKRGELQRIHAHEHTGLLERDNREKLEVYLNELDEADSIDQGRLDKAFVLDIDPKHLPDPNDIKARIKKHEDAIREMKETGETQLLFTDPEARVMLTKDGGKRVCYNIQAATDAESHMILGFQVTNDRNDMNKLCTTAKTAMENTGNTSVEAIADKGYSSSKDVEECLFNGIAPQVGMICDREERVVNLEYRPAKITEEKRASQNLEDIRDCLHAGILPKCYENTDITIELAQESMLSCFIRHEDGTVTCPMGKVMLFQGAKKNGIVYGSKEACRTCPNRCTDGKTFKTVKFGPQTIYVPVKMYGSPRYALQTIPDVMQPDHYHAFGRVSRSPARVMIYIKRNVDKLKERFRVS